MSALPAASIHLVTSRRRASPDARTVRDELLTLEHLIDEAIDAGVDVVQIRESDLEAGLLCAFVARVVGRAGPTAVRVLVSDRADVARAAGAAGVHLPSRGMVATRVRSLDQAWIIGRSIHGDERPADVGALDYLTFGTVFPSASKTAGSPTAGLVGLGAAAATTGLPLVAIGGITPERATACLAAGAAGVAAIGSFLPVGRAPEALGPRAAVVAFQRARERHGLIQ